MNPSARPLRLLPGRIALAAVLAFGAGGWAFAALDQASITESVNSVSYQASAHSPQKAAHSGTIIHPDNIVRTGVNSRAELQFSDNTVTRMGANSIFSYDAKAQRMDLTRGSALFSKPKNDDSFEIVTPAATCSISGTTGFLQVVPGSNGHISFVFGLIEGHTDVTLGGKTYGVGSGDLLVSTGNGIVHLTNFNITTFMAKAGLAKKFKSRLPNETEIEEAERHFASLVERGFIEPTDFAFGDDNGQLALVQNFTVTPDQSIRQLGTQIQTFESILQGISSRGGPTGGFVNVGGNGVIRGQLVWNVDVDLDLHLTLPNGAGEVFYGNRTITFNNGAAVASLDADNLGGVVNVPPDKRVENIIVTGVPASGIYNFFPVYFGGSEPASYTLTVTGNGGKTTTVTTGTLTGSGQQGTPNPVVIPPVTTPQSTGH